jgi:hypothetical protein
MINKSPKICFDDRKKICPSPMWQLSEITMTTKTRGFRSLKITHLWYRYTSIIWFYLLLGKTIILFLIYFALWGKLAGTGSVNELLFLN